MYEVPTKLIISFLKIELNHHESMKASFPPKGVNDFLINNNVVRYESPRNEAGLLGEMSLESTDLSRLTRTLVIFLYATLNRLIDLN